MPVPIGYKAALNHVTNYIGSSYGLRTGAGLSGKVRIFCGVEAPSVSVGLHLGKEENQGFFSSLNQFVTTWISGD